MSIFHVRQRFVHPRWRVRWVGVQSGGVEPRSPRLVLYFGGGALHSLEPLAGTPSNGPRMLGWIQVGWGSIGVYGVDPTFVNPALRAFCTLGRQWGTGLRAWGPQWTPIGHGRWPSAKSEVVRRDFFRSLYYIWRLIMFKSKFLDRLNHWCVHTGSLKTTIFHFFANFGGAH